jgi:dynactin 4
MPFRQFNMLVTYTYRSEAAAAAEDPQPPSKGDNQAATSEMKTFSFYTAVSLGPIGSRVDVRRDDPRS